MPVNSASVHVHLCNLLIVRTKTTTSSLFFQEPLPVLLISPCRTSKGTGTFSVRLAARPEGSSLEWGKALWEFLPSPSEEQLNLCPKLDMVSSGWSKMTAFPVNVSFVGLTQIICSVVEVTANEWLVVIVRFLFVYHVSAFFLYCSHIHQTQAN